MWNAFDSAAATSEVRTEPAAPVGGSLPAISAVVSSLRAMVSAAPAKRTRSPSTRKRKKRPEESCSKEKPTKKKRKSEERSKRRQKRSTRSTRKERKEKNKKERSKPAENEERIVETAPCFGEVANKAGLPASADLPPETQGSELSEASLALMDSSERLDADMWEEVDESVLLQDFLEADSSWPGDDNSLLPSDETGTQELVTSNFLEADSKSVVASVAAAVGSSQAGLDGAPPTKRKPAQRFKPHELDILKAVFQVDSLPSHTTKKALAEQMATSTARISTWYDVSLKLEAFVATRH